MEIHPDDILIFQEVSAAMRIVAKNYDLEIKSIRGLPFPRKGMFDRLGDCSVDGNIRLVLRCTVDGKWEDAPCSPDQIWDTGAHELAHLRYFDHGQEFLDFCEELQIAMNNQKTDHRQKVIDKLIKMQNSREGEASLGNEAAAEAFASAINRMMIEYELSPTDLDYSRATDRDPVIEVPVDLDHYKIEHAKTRVAWMETLASGVATAHLCKILIRPGSNQIYFVGTRSHATVAEYVFGCMVPFISKTSKTAEIAYWKATGCGRGKNNQALGYRAAWIDAFIQRIWERFREARQAAVAEAAARQGTSTETGLMRLDDALVKVKKYIDDRFAGKAARSVGQLNHRSRNHTEGRMAGREAADKITLGKRGLNPGVDRKQIS